MKYNSIFKNIISGFTLLEALMAVSILMVAVVAPITVSQKGLSSAVYAKNQMVASYLAQDAIEYIKNKRDGVSIRNDFVWDNFLTYFSPCFGGNSCQIDTVKNSLNISDDISVYSNNKPLKLGSPSGDYPGFYQYMEGESTNFTRKIQITLSDELDSNSKKYKALVTVTVSWSGDNKVEVKTLIFNY